MSAFWRTHPVTSPLTNSYVPKVPTLLPHPPNIIMLHYDFFFYCVAPKTNQLGQLVSLKKEESALILDKKWSGSNLMKDGVSGTS